VPEVNILHETAEPARSYSTFVQKRLAGEAVAGPITNITSDQYLSKEKHTTGANFLSEEENEFLFGLGGSGSPKNPQQQSATKKQPEAKFPTLPSQDDTASTTTAGTTPYSSSILTTNDKDKTNNNSLPPFNPLVANEFKTYSASAYNPSLPGSLVSNNYSSTTTTHKESGSSISANNSYQFPKHGNILSNPNNDEFNFNMPNHRNNEDSLFQDSMFSDGNSMNK
jgi:hypothetical protein